MSFTMVKKQLFIIHLLCVITLSTSAKSLGLVKEFNNADLKKDKTNGLHETTKTTIEKIKTENLNDLQKPNSKSQPENNSNLQGDDSMYTLSDLEEAVSKEIKNRPVEDKEVKNNKNELTDDKALLDIYTESDLDETKSQDKVKPEVDKKSSSFLFVPHKRHKRSATAHPDEENGEGSGEGLVNEFEIEDSNNATIDNKTDHRNKTKTILPSKKEINVTKKHLHNDKNKTRSQIHDTSMYTETDLEETSSQNDLKFDGPNTNDNVANNTKENHDFGNNETEMSNIYTDSDLEATASKDKKKHGETPEKDKKSAGSYLFVPHKREIANSEHEEGSGEGSGNEPLTNDTS